MVSAFDSAVKTAKSPLVNWKPCCWAYTKVTTPLLWLLFKWAHWMITELAKENSLLLYTESYITKESTDEDTFWLEFTYISTHSGQSMILLFPQTSLLPIFQICSFQVSGHHPSKPLLQGSEKIQNNLNTQKLIQIKIFIEGASKTDWSGTAIQTWELTVSLDIHFGKYLSRKNTNICVNQYRMYVLQCNQSNLFLLCSLRN